MLSMWEDLRYAARSVTRARGLTAVLVLSLALGTGANAAVCGVVYALLIRAPAGVRDAGTLVSIHTSEFSGAPYGRSSFPDYRSIAASPALEALAAADDTTLVNARLGSSALQVRVAAVTDGYFDVLRMQPHAGRLLTAADAHSSPQGGIISVALADTLGGIDAVLGQTISIGAEDAVVVGIAPPKFRGLQASRLTDVWVPLAGDYTTDRGDRRFELVGRRAVDVVELPPPSRCAPTPAASPNIPAARACGVSSSRRSSRSRRCS